MRIQKKRKTVWVTLLLVAIGLFIYLHNVPKEVTTEDAKYINFLFGERDFFANTASYEEQILFIHQIQEEFNKKVKLGPGQSLGEPREPKDVFENGVGECYDRSRFLEKTFMLYGFKTRHVSLFTLRHGGKVFKSLITKNHITHSTFEVKTLNGWLNVDPNINWIAMDINRNPLNYKYISYNLRNESTIAWCNKPPGYLMHFYRQPGFGIYGLYSRHGRFYPPYNSIPDFNFRELFYNFNL